MSQLKFAISNKHKIAYRFTKRTKKAEIAFSKKEYLTAMELFKKVEKKYKLLDFYDSDFFKRSENHLEVGFIYYRIALLHEYLGDKDEACRYFNETYRFFAAFYSDTYLTDTRRIKYPLILFQVCKRRAICYAEEDPHKMTVNLNYALNYAQDYGEHIPVEEVLDIYSYLTQIP